MLQLQRIVLLYLRLEDITVRLLSVGYEQRIRTESVTNVAFLDCC